MWASESTGKVRRTDPGKGPIRQTDFLFGLFVDPGPSKMWLRISGTFCFVYYSWCQVKPSNMKLGLMQLIILIPT
jgi:hypothetical protein